MSEEPEQTSTSTPADFRDKLFPPDTPMRFESRNRRCKSSDREIGQVYTVELEIDQETWLALQTTPRNAIFACVAWWNDGDEPAPATKRKSKKTAQAMGRTTRDKTTTPVGQFWQRLFKGRYMNGLPLIEVLGVTVPEDVHGALCEAFDVSSLNEVAPHRFVEWATSKHLDYLVTAAHRIWSEVEGKWRTDGETW